MGCECHTIPMQSLTFPIRSDKLTMTVAVTEHVFHRKTEFQTIDIYDTEVFGKILFLDGHVQLAELDEHAYHEALVHIPLLNIEQPKSALVVGGGDGGVLRELCRHRSLERIHLVDIDQGVIDASRQFLPSLNGGAFDDPRVTLFIEDAFAFIKNVSEPYDLIVMDVTDVYEEEEGELSEKLFTVEFHRDCAAALSGQGMMVSQADNHVFCPYSMVDVVSDFRAVFPLTGSYQALVPSFGGFSGYVWASKGAQVLPTWPSQRAAQLNLRYLTPTTYALALEGGQPGGMFA
jgi:spermidine synthase